jgi:transmembrane sensor
MRGLALYTERARALGPDFEPTNFRVDSGRPVSRRLILGATSAFAATLAGVGYVAWGRLERKAQFGTAKGEVRMIPLPDGSVVTLNTASKVAVEYSEARRNVRLLGGEALFDVAKDHVRPFVVSAGGTQVRAIGTSFTVRHLPDAPVQILVQEGVVEVVEKSDRKRRAIRLGPNSRANSSAHQISVSTAITLPELRRELAWREGRIEFEGQTLAEAVAEFARYSDTTISVEDPQMSREEIAGRFQGNDPIGFARAVAVSLNGHVVIGDGEVRLTR